MEPVRQAADPSVVNSIIGQLKSKGFFDQFRRDCLADVDTKPAYQNLRQRVEGYVSNYLGQHKWEPGMNKNQLRDSLRRQINQSEMLATGVERIIEQVVEPKIQHIFRPQIEDLVRATLDPDSIMKTDRNANGVDNAASMPTDIVAPLPEAPPPETPSEPAPLPPPLPDEDDDMDISTPSPTSSPDIRLTSPVDDDEINYDEESPPPIPGIETDEAVDFDISQTVAMETNIETEEVPMAVEMETVTSSQVESGVVSTDNGVKISTVGSLQEQGSLPAPSVNDNTKPAQQVQIVDTLATEDISSTELPNTSDDDDVISRDISKKKKDRRRQDSDAESGLSDITVSSVHTSDLSSFDEEISSDSDESESSESSSDDSKRGAKQKSPRKTKTGDLAEVSYRNVKLAHRGQGWFLEKYIFVKSRENKHKIFLHCQHKYLCKAVAYIDKTAEKAYLKPGQHEHPPPDARKITFASDTKGSKKQEKHKKESKKLPPIKLSLSKPASPSEAKDDALSPVSSDEDGIFSGSDKESDKDALKPKEDSTSSQQSPPRKPLRDMTPEERKAEAARWAAYYEYSVAPARRMSTKALALSRYHSDSEDEDAREERRKKAASDKEERARRRQERRESGVIQVTPPRPPRVRREPKEKSDKEESRSEESTPSKRQSLPKSPVKATKAQLKEQKIMEKKREMRRQRSLNRKYFSEDFSSPIQANLKESLKVEDRSITHIESHPLSPVKKPVSGKIKPRVLSFSLLFRERRVPQVESHFLLCSCLSGEQQKKMSSRQQKQKSRREGKRQAKFSFIAKTMKQQQQQQQQRKRPRRTDTEGKHSDISRSSTPVQDEMPMEAMDTARPEVGASRSSTPVQDEESGVVAEVAADVQVKVETVKRKRGRPRKYTDDGQETSSRSATPTPAVQESQGIIYMEEQKQPVPSVPVEAEPLEENYSRSSTPVQDEMVVEEMVVQNFGSAIETVVIPAEPGMGISVLQTQQVVEEMDVTNAPVVGMSVDIEPVKEVGDIKVVSEETGIDSAPVKEMVVSEKPSEQVVTMEEASVGVKPVSETESDRNIVQRSDFSGGDFWKMLAAVPTSIDVKQTEIESSKDQISDQIQTEPCASKQEDKADDDSKMVVEQLPEIASSENIEKAEDVDMNVEDYKKVASESPSGQKDQNTEEAIEQKYLSPLEVKEQRDVSSPEVKEQKDVSQPGDTEQSIENENNLQEATKEEPVSGVKASKQEETDTTKISKQVDSIEEMEVVQEKDVSVAGAEKEKSSDKETKMDDSTPDFVKKEKSVIGMDNKEDSQVSAPEKEEIPVNIPEKVLSATEDEKSVESAAKKEESLDVVSEQEALTGAVEKEETSVRAAETMVDVAKKAKLLAEMEEIAISAIDKEELSVGAAEKEETMVDASKDRKSPDGTAEKEETSVGAAEKEESSVGAAEKEETPVGAAEKEETPVGAAEKEETPVCAAEKKETSVGAAEKEETSVGASEKKEISAGATEQNKISSDFNEKGDSHVESDSKEKPMSVDDTTTSDDKEVENIETSIKAKSDELKDLGEEGQSKVETKPIVGHSPTPDEITNETEAENEQKDEKVKKNVEKSQDNESELVAVPAVGSSPTRVKSDDEDSDQEEQKGKEAEKIVKQDQQKEDDLIIPALGQSPTGSPTQGETQKMDVDSEDNPPNISDNPPTPTQDEPSSMDDMSSSAAEEAKPAIPIFAVTSPSKSPLEGLFLGGQSGSQEESPDVESNLESEESTPAIRETRQRSKRRVSTPQDIDFECSRPKRSRNETPTPPPPVLEPELPIERPEETQTRTTRASRQKHISPPSTPKDTRARHQSSQSNESQQSTRTPSPVPTERVTRGRRSARQSEDKQSHRYSDMVYYVPGKRSQKQQSPPTTAAAASVGSRRSSRRTSDAQATEKPLPTRGKRKR